MAHAGIWYILRAQRGSHVPTLGPKYALYTVATWTFWVIHHSTHKPLNPKPINLKTKLLIDARKPSPAVKFRNGEIVQTTTLAKYLGSLVSWDKLFDFDFKHRAGIAETHNKSGTKMELPLFR